MLVTAISLLGKNDVKYLLKVEWIIVADAKYTSNVRPLLENAKELAGKPPNTFITDGAPNFHSAFNKEFFTLKDPRTRRISRLQGDHVWFEKIYL